MTLFATISVVAVGTLAVAVLILSMAGVGCTIDEPLLASPRDSESSADVAARFARALRALHAFDSRYILVVLDQIGLCGSSGFELDDEALLRHGLEVLARSPR